MNNPRKRPHVPFTFSDMLVKAQTEVRTLRGMIAEEPAVDRHLLRYASDAEDTINATVKRYHQSPDQQPKEMI